MLNRVWTENFNQEHGLQATQKPDTGVDMHAHIRLYPAGLATSCPAHSILHYATVYVNMCTLPHPHLPTPSPPLPTLQLNSLRRVMQDVAETSLSEEEPAQVR